MEEPKNIIIPTEKEEQKNESKDNEPPARKQKLINLPRSDSIGSGSGKRYNVFLIFVVLIYFMLIYKENLVILGRKYLAPTLSDPSARQEKERAPQTKKKNNSIRTNPPVNKNLTHLNDSDSNKMPREVIYKN